MLQRNTQWGAAPAAAAAAAGLCSSGVRPQHAAVRACVRGATRSQDSPDRPATHGHLRAQPAVPDGSAPAPCRMTSSTRRMAAAQLCAARRPRPLASWQAAPPAGADPPLGGTQGDVGSKGSSRLAWLGSAEVPGCVVAASGGPMGAQTNRASSKFTCSADPCLDMKA